MAKEPILDSAQVQKLTQLVDESIRASREGVKHFVEPTPGVLAKAKSRRHNIIFGRRGSGKSSLLQKISADLTVDRTPIALVDLETFKQHSYTSRKIEALHRNIMRYQHLFAKLSALANGPSFLLLDDLYHLRLADQASVIDYFHRIAKGSNLWLKVGTIRHRSRWYVLGNPPTGMKLGDDADEIDLDVTLEKYDVSKAFLMRVLTQFASEAGVDLPSILADGARDRLVLASGGVARDFLTIFNRSVQVARERLVAGKLARGEKVGSEDVNVAAGQQGVFKEEDFNRDTGTTEDRDRLMSQFHDILEFCTQMTKANCILIEKDITSFQGAVNAINELVDLKFLHRAKFRVTVRDRVGRLYDAYMLDLSQYTGERARRDFEMVKFWGPDSDDALRKASLIYLEREAKSKSV